MLTIREYTGGFPAVAAMCVVVFSVAACDTRTPTENGVAVTAPAAAQSADHDRDELPKVVRPEEQSFADLALRVPSSAGFLLDSLGLRVMVRDQHDADAAIVAATELGSSQGLLHRATSVRTEKVDFSFGELARWRDLVFEQIFNGVAGVSSLDLDERLNRVAIGLVPSSEARARGEVLALLEKYGVPEAAVLFKSEPYLTAMGGASIETSASSQLPPLLTDYFADIVGGVQITSSQAANGVANAPCSVGFTAWYQPPWGGEPYLALATASHCTQVWGASDGTAFTQPSTGTPVVGFEARDPDKYRCGWNWCRGSDAALVRVNGRSMQVGLIARTTFAAAAGPFVSGSRQIDQSSPYFVITQTAYVPVGTVYSKMGRTTGWTSGEKLQSCYDHHFSHPNAGLFYDLYTTRCADKGSAWTDGGDSGGSVFVRLDSNNVALLGTTVGRAGSSGSDPHVYSPFSRIAVDMGGTLIVTRPALATPAVSASVVGGQARLDWSAVSGATGYKVEIVDYVQECDDFGFGWQCLVHGYPSSTIVSTSYFLDPRSTFTRVLASWEAGLVRTHYTISARNTMTGAFSLPAAVVRFERVD